MGRGELIILAEDAAPTWLGVVGQDVARQGE